MIKNSCRNLSFTSLGHLGQIGHLGHLVHFFIKNEEKNYTFTKKQALLILFDVNEVNDKDFLAQELMGVYNA